MDNQKGLFLTVAEAADVLAVSRKTICRLVWRGELPSRRVGRTVRIPAAAITDGGVVRAAGGGAAAAMLRSESGSRFGIGVG